MALYGALAKENHFSEFNTHLRSRGNVLTPDQRRGAAMGNLLGLTATVTDGQLSYSLTSAAASGDIRPINVETTYSGSGATGGRARYHLTITGTMGSWSNALKGHVAYGAAGKTTGLGSAIVAELELSAGTTAGTYAPLEVELGVGSGASTGTKTSFAVFNVHGAGAGAFDDNGFLFDIQGLTGSDAGHLFDEVAATSVVATARLRVKVGATTYYIPLTANATLVDT